MQALRFSPRRLQLRALATSIAADKPPTPPRPTRRSHATLRVEPNHRLVLRGACANVRLATNDTSDTVTIEPNPTEDARLLVNNGVNYADGKRTLHVRSLQADDVTITIPAAFELDVDCAQYAPEDQVTNVTLDGWLEGALSILVNRGDIRVGVVRGMETSLQTRSGSVGAKLIEGNLRAHAGGGKVELEKVLGEHVEIRGGGVTCGALYAKTLSARVDREMHVSVLGVEDSRIALGDGAQARLCALEGKVALELSDTWDVELQSSNRLCHLSILRREQTSRSGEPAARSLALSLPEDIRAVADFGGQAQASHVDPALEPRGDGRILGAQAPDAHECKLDFAQLGQATADVVIKRQSWLEQALGKGLGT